MRIANYAAGMNRKSKRGHRALWILGEGPRRRRGWHCCVAPSGAALAHHRTHGDPSRPNLRYPRAATAGTDTTGISFGRVRTGWPDPGTKARQETDGNGSGAELEADDGGRGAIPATSAERAIGQDAGGARPGQDGRWWCRTRSGRRWPWRRPRHVRRARHRPRRGWRETRSRRSLPRSISSTSHISRTLAASLLALAAFALCSGCTLLPPRVTTLPRTCSSQGASTRLRSRRIQKGSSLLRISTWDTPEPSWKPPAS